MRVHDRNLTGASAAETGRAQEMQKPDNAGSSRVQTGGFGDRVEFSSTLGRLSKALAASGVNRAARVEALAAQYQSGNYQVNAGAVSRSMVTDALAAGD